MDLPDFPDTRVYAPATCSGNAWVELPVYGRQCLLPFLHLSLLTTRPTLADFNKHITSQADIFSKEVREAGWRRFELHCITDTNNRAWVVVDERTSLLWLMLYAPHDRIQRAFADVCECLLADSQSAKEDLALAVKCGYDLNTLFKHTGHEWLRCTVPASAYSSDLDYTSAAPSMPTSTAGPKGGKRMTVMDPDLYALQPYRDLYDRCVQRWTSLKGASCIVLASVPDYRQSDVNKSWVCPVNGCGKKYPKPQLMFAHLDQHEDLHGQRVHLYTTYQDSNAPNPLHDNAIVFKSSSDYLVGSKKRERSVPHKRGARKRPRLSRLAEAAETVQETEHQVHCKVVEEQQQQEGGGVPKEQQQQQQEQEQRQEQQLEHRDHGASEAATTAEGDNVSDEQTAMGNTEQNKILEVELTIYAAKLSRYLYIPSSKHST